MPRSPQLADQVTDRMHTAHIQQQPRRAPGHRVTRENLGTTVMLEVKVAVCAGGVVTGMSPLRDLVEARREQVKAVAARHHASRVRLFGSVARGDERPESDIDLLVDFTDDSSLFDLMRMTRELEDLLGHPVDVVSAGGLKDRDRDIIDESVDL